MMDRLSAANAGLNYADLRPGGFDLSHALNRHLGDHFVRHCR
jgi:hypothetical protein